jgi:acyl carrier protein
MTEITTADTDSATLEVGVAVRAALSDVLRRDLRNAADSAGLFTEIGLDSTGVLDLLMALEESLGIEVDTEDLRMSDFSTVASLTEFVARELAR